LPGAKLNAKKLEAEEFTADAAMAAIATTIRITDPRFLV
jgi:hypothetical protein